MHFLRWCHDTFGDPLPPGPLAQILKCKLPYGWFAKYQKAHKELQYVSAGGARKRYLRALQDHLRRTSVAGLDISPGKESTVVEASAVAEDYHDRFK